MEFEWDQDKATRNEKKQGITFVEATTRLRLEWNLQRTLAKVNYRIHTDAIKETLLPAEVTKAQAATVYANEADLLNVALFDRLTHH